jgi:hypothetical protein
MDRVAGPQKMVGTGNFPKTPRTGFFRRRMILRISAARPCRSSGCDPPPSCVASGLVPRGDLKLAGLATASERRALALLPNCPPPAPTPLSHRLSVRTLLHQKNFANDAPALCRESICEYSVTETTYRTGRGVRILCFSKILRTWLSESRELLIPRIAAAGTSFSPLRCQAWHGYKVTIAHGVEVEVGADGHGSAPLYGATAAAPPAGAQIE